MKLSSCIDCLIEAADKGVINTHTCTQLINLFEIYSNTSAKYVIECEGEACRIYRPQ